MHNRKPRSLLFCTFLILGAVLHPMLGNGQALAWSDTDRDGLSDQLEQRLLDQFAPDLHIAAADCSAEPAEFRPGLAIPTVLAENGTLYGQVFLAKGSTATHPLVELHFYHLWRQDCGPHGHPLDTEHVAVLLRASTSDLSTASWHAQYWYAAAHENTVCDVSQIARASTLNAVGHGAKVWVSPGKHASYLNSALCRRGCGSDHCESMTSLPHGSVINLGEIGHPMNGSSFVDSPRWPLATKMSSSNFPAASIARLEALPDTEIAWFNPGRHPAQGVISVSSSTEGALANSTRSTGEALSTGTDSTADAISVAQDHTGNALANSYRETVHSLGNSARHVGKALRLTPKAPVRPQ